VFYYNRERKTHRTSTTASHTKGSKSLSTTQIINTPHLSLFLYLPSHPHSQSVSQSISSKPEKPQCRRRRASPFSDNKGFSLVFKEEKRTAPRLNLFFSGFLPCSSSNSLVFLIRDELLLGFFFCYSSSTRVLEHIHLHQSCEEKEGEEKEGSPRVSL
jgi:hypothetical protein